MSSTTLASLGHVLWRTAVAHNVDPDRLFAQAGLDPEILERPRARMEFSQMCRGWRNLVEITGIPHLGLEGAVNFRPGDLHAIGTSFLASANLLDGLTRIDRYESILNTELDFSVIRKPGDVEFVFSSDDIPDEVVHVIEDLRTAVVVRLARMGIGTEISLLRAGFTHRGPVDTSPYREFFRCPVQFSAEMTYIAFDIKDCRKPFTARNLDLVRETDQILDRLLSSMEHQDIVSRAKSIITTSLASGTLAEADLASALNVSPRTLHRRLSEQSTSFRGILNEVRQTMAEGYLLETTISITEIAYHLGFSDVSSFSRAFKSWVGSSPAVYREVGRTDQ